MKTHTKCHISFKTNTVYRGPPLSLQARVVALILNQHINKKRGLKGWVTLFLHRMNKEENSKNKVRRHAFVSHEQIYVFHTMGTGWVSLGRKNQLVPPFYTSFWKKFFFQGFIIGPRMTRHALCATHFESESSDSQGECDSCDSHTIHAIQVQK